MRELQNFRRKHVFWAGAQKAKQREFSTEIIADQNFPVKMLFACPAQWVGAGAEAQASGVKRLGDYWRWLPRRYSKGGWVQSSWVSPGKSLACQRGKRSLSQGHSTLHAPRLHDLKFQRQDELTAVCDPRGGHTSGLATSGAGTSARGGGVGWEDGSAVCDDRGGCDSHCRSHTAVSSCRSLLTTFCETMQLGSVEWTMTQGQFLRESTQPTTDCLNFPPGLHCRRRSSRIQ